MEGATIGSFTYIPFNVKVNSSSHRGQLYMKKIFIGAVAYANKGMGVYLYSVF